MERGAHSTRGTGEPCQAIAVASFTEEPARILGMPVAVGFDRAGDGCTCRVTGIIGSATAASSPCVPKSTSAGASRQLSADNSNRMIVAVRKDSAWNLNASRVPAVAPRTCAARRTREAGRARAVASRNEVAANRRPMGVTVVVQ